MRNTQRFQIYWLGQTLSGFGDAFALVAIPLLVLDATHSVACMGLISAAGVGAQVAASFFSGTIVDRVNRRVLMLACDFCRAGVYGLVPLAAWFQHVPLALLYFVMIAGGCLANIFSVAYMTAVPSLVQQDSLHSANAKLQGSLAFAYVLGSMAGGSVASMANPAGALSIDAVTFLISALSLTVIRFDSVTSAAGKADDTSFGSGLRFLWKHSLLRDMTCIIVLLGLTGNIGVGAGITDLMIYHVRYELNQGPTYVGICIGIVALGAVLGAVVAPKLSRLAGSGWCFLSGNFVQAAGLVTLGIMHRFDAACIGGLLWGAGMMMRGVPMNTLRQTLIPNELLGRVTALSWTAILMASAAGTAIITRLASLSSAATVLTQVGLGVVVIGFGALAYPTIRRG
ncbi:MAG: MFS transporter [Desulfosporosinus sp.]|nr:MFS transporter [Desulfosporosinus sp.]